MLHDGWMIRTCENGVLLLPAVRRLEEAFLATGSRRSADSGLALDDALLQPDLQQVRFGCCFGSGSHTCWVSSGVKSFGLIITGEGV